MKKEKNKKVFIFMGVSGSGKSVIGEAFAQKFGVKFIDGDDLHPRFNILKMKEGMPLNDEDRFPWLERINDAVFSLNHKNEGGVIVCSALKKTYRDQIRQNNNNLIFFFLKGSFELIKDRMAKREGHFMKVAMLESQFQTLEMPTNESDVLTIDIEGSIKEVLKRCEIALNALP